MVLLIGHSIKFDNPTVLLRAASEFTMICKFFQPTNQVQLHPTEDEISRYQQENGTPKD